MVERGVWDSTGAEEASRAEFAQLLPEGVRTPRYRFCHVIEQESGKRVGETWYISQTKGGKTQFWIDWIWIEPPYRRRGYASQVLARLEELAV